MRFWDSTTFPQTPPSRHLLQVAARCSQKFAFMDHIMQAHIIMHHKYIWCTSRLILHLTQSNDCIPSYKSSPKHHKIMRAEYFIQACQTPPSIQSNTLCISREYTAGRPISISISLFKRPCPTKRRYPKSPAPSDNSAASTFASES